MRHTAFLVWIKTVPGPVNLQTRPSADDMPEMRPPEATRSSMYFVFHATRWPLSTMYFSPSASCKGGGGQRDQLHVPNVLRRTNNQLL